MGTAGNCNVRINIGPIAGKMSDSTVTVSRTFNQIEKGVEINLDKEVGRLINNKRGNLFYWGEISYVNSSNKQSSKIEKVSFGPHVIKGVPTGGGGYDAPDLQAELLLYADSSSYKVETRFAKTLKSGETTRVKLKIGARQSSSHEFRVVSYFDDGSKQESIPVQVDIFLPYTGVIAYIYKTEKAYIQGSFPFYELIDSQNQR